MRLTASLKENIAAAVLAHAFDAEKNAVTDALTKLGDDVYRDLYPQALVRKLKALPGGMFPTKDQIGVRFGADYTNLSFSEPRLLGHDHWKHAVVYPADHALSIRYSELSNRSKANNALRREMRAEVRGILDSVTTVGKLIKVWPEVSSFVPPIIGMENRNLPAIPVERLNNLLGLPPEVKA